MPEIASDLEDTPSFIGELVDVNDRIPNAQCVRSGKGGSIRWCSNQHHLATGNFKSTNGPDLYIYLSTDRSTFYFVSLAGLRAI